MRGFIRSALVVRKKSHEQSPHTSSHASSHPRVKDASAFQTHRNGVVRVALGPFCRGSVLEVGGKVSEGRGGADAAGRDH